MTIGTQLKQVRTNKGVTQQTLADALHVTRAAVSNWETDRSQPDLATLTAICAYFDLTLDAFVKEETAMQHSAWYQRPAGKWLIAGLVLLCLGAGFINQIYDIGYAMGKALAYWLG